MAWLLGGFLCLSGPGAAMAAEAAVGEAVGPANETVVAPEAEGIDEPQRIVVTATRIPTAIENISGSASIITSEIAETRQYRTAVEALRNIPGVTIRQTGGPGSQTSLFMRGLPSQYTKIMRDGMPINDPSTPQGSYDFADLTLDNLSQIEVLRGSQSMLYGSAGVAGVVNMVSKKGEGPLTGFLSAEGGNRGTVLSRFGLSAGTDKADFSFGGSGSHTDGISSLDKHMYGFTEKDGYGQGSLSLRLGANPIESLRFDLFVNGQISELEFDSGVTDPSWAYQPYDAPVKVRKEYFSIRPQASLALFDGKWEQTIGFGYAETKRKNKDDEPINLPFGFTYNMNRALFYGKTTKFDYQSIIHVHETNTILAGIDVISDGMTQQATRYGPGTTAKRKYDTITTTGIYIEDRININDFFIASLGVRNDHHEKFGDYATWKTGAMFNLPSKTRIKGNVGTGFRAPGLYELYGDGMFVSQNLDLEPEKSTGWDAGFEQSLFGDRLAFGATYFENRIKNLIAYNAGGYENVQGKSKRWGVESFLTYAFTDDFSITGQYTWLQAKNLIDPSDRTVKLRRPLNEFSINADWRFREKGIFSAGVNYVGRRWDQDTFPFPVEDHRMGSYVTARIAASWKFNNNFEAFGKVDNLFDRKYQDTYSYGATGITFSVGAAISF
ncbi:MAG: TonB-dependent receptor [Planctomycetota bacterium]|nr:TonB-dependent receptor [Planctomycetota bacterium]